MANKTKIEWTETTWNPIRGCSRVSEGCRNCYAESVANRFKGDGQPYEGLIAKGGQWNGKITVAEHLIDQPLRWRKPRMIFVNSMSDLFHENVPTSVIDEIFAVMAICPQHTFQILTKRPERMLEYFKSFNGQGAEARGFNVCSEFAHRRKGGADLISKIPEGLPNVWLGVSVEDQATADERIPLLLQTPAAVRWISAEPLLGKLSMRWFPAWPTNTGGACMNPDNGGVTDHLDGLRCLDWVVVGGESGKNARPMHPDRVRLLRDQCAEADVPFFFKQWGEFAPNWFYGDDGKYNGGPVWMDRMGKKAAGRLLDGVLHDEYPARLEVTTWN